MKFLLKFIKTWLPLAAGFTILFGFVYLSVQQTYRTGADDPQIQMAEDAAAQLASGTKANQIVPTAQVDIASSLAPYWIVYDANGQPMASNAVLHGSLPALPSGVFDYTRQHGEDRISWQPEQGVRSAVVVVAVNGGKDGFVLAGRSLREVENRESSLTSLIGLGWLVTLGAAAILVVLLELVPAGRAA